MDKNVTMLLNEQINKEFSSAYLYLNIANYYEARGLDGFAHWFEAQAGEEQEHGMRIYRYMQDNNSKVELETIEKPERTYNDAMAPLKEALEHERYITASINGIYLAAQSVNDFRTMQFLDWFINEQAEEEKTASDMIVKMELCGLDHGLYILNKEFWGRK